MSRIVPAHRDRWITGVIAWTMLAIALVKALRRSLPISVIPIPSGPYAVGSQAYKAEIFTYLIGATAFFLVSQWNIGLANGGAISRRLATIGVALLGLSMVLPELCGHNVLDALLNTGLIFIFISLIIKDDVDDDETEDCEDDEW